MIHLQIVFSGAVFLIIEIVSPLHALLVSNRILRVSIKRIRYIEIGMFFKNLFPSLSVTANYINLVPPLLKLFFVIFSERIDAT